MTINFGLIGPGNIADRKLVPAVKEVDGAEFWSVTSRSKEKAEEFGKKHGAVPENYAYDDYEKMLSDPELDAVIVSTPDKLHAEHGIKAAQAGKHVLMEKPMAASTAGGRELLEARDENGIKLGVGYHLRWHGAHRGLMRKLEDGTLGKLHHVRVQWTFRAEDDSNWRADDEVGRWWSLGRTGTHGLDLVLWALSACGEVVEMESTIAREHWKGPHDETAMINLKFESGATGELTTSILFESEPEFKIYGRDGSAICRDTLGPDGEGELIISDENLNFPVLSLYEQEIEDFIRAIKDDREPEVTGEEGLRNVEIMEKAAPTEQ
ncbi:MAG: Gfo/Idh/MocA family protein [Candidatus Acetothermia bacterium]